MPIDEWLFLALVALLPVMQPFHLEFGRYVLPPADFVFIVLGVAFAWAVIRRRRHVRITGWCWTLAAYAAALVVSTAASENPRVSAVKLAGELYLLGMAFLTVNYVDSLPSLRRALTAWLVGTVMTVAAAVAGVLLFYAGRTGPSNIFLATYGSLPPGPYPRVMGLFLNMNMLCIYLVAGAAILLAMQAAGWIGNRVVMTLLAGVTVAALFTISPGLGGLCLVFGIWGWRALGPRSPAAAALCAVAGAVGAIGFLAAITVSPVSIQTLAPSSRVLTWVGAWNTFLAHPYLGRGLGLEVADVRYLNASGSYEVLTDAHNTWLSVMAQDGVVGLAALALVIVTLARRIKVPDLTAPPASIARRGLELAFVGGFLYQTLSGSFENTRHVWVLMALVDAAQGLAPDA
jgi:hypothetical protein